jgi:crotonobetainyl-CoA:carnitine CoA-transferase CaiB-like acyl-CoA transferase
MGAYPTTDGWIVVQVMENQWPGFCRAMGRKDLLTDERFVDLTARQKHRQDLHALVEAWTSSMPSAAVLGRLEAHRVPCAPVLEPADAIGHPYFEGRRAVRQVHDPVLGSLSIPGNPLRFSEQPDDLELVAPLLGEHNEAVLRELGYDDATIAALHSCGVLHRGDR